MTTALGTWRPIKRIHPRERLCVLPSPIGAVRLELDRTDARPRLGDKRPQHHSPRVSPRFSASQRNAGELSRNAQISSRRRASSSYPATGLEARVTRARLKDDRLAPRGRDHRVGGHAGLRQARGLLIAEGTRDSAREIRAEGDSQPRGGP
jgi:hypothetical protein